MINSGAKPNLNGLKKPIWEVVESKKLKGAKTASAVDQVLLTIIN